MRYETPDVMIWTTEAARSGGGTVYDVLRGDLSEPAVGMGFHHRVRGSNACGVGSDGASSSSAERVGATCP